MEKRIVRKLVDDSVFLCDIAARLNIHPSVYLRMLQHTGYLPGVPNSGCGSSNDDSDICYILRISQQRSIQTENKKDIYLLGSSFASLKL